MIPESHAGSAGLRILVVDDDSDTAESMARLLTITGHQVRIAHDGPQALAMIPHWLPDFVMLDIGLPAMDGYEVASRLREVTACRDTVIIAVTGYGQPEDHRRSAAAGIDHHLVKPAEWSVIRTLLAVKRPPSINPPRSNEDPAGGIASPLDEESPTSYRTLFPAQLEPIHRPLGRANELDWHLSRRMFP